MTKVMLALQKVQSSLSARCADTTDITSHFNNEKHRFHICIYVNKYTEQWTWRFYLSRKGLQVQRRHPSVLMLPDRIKESLLWSSSRKGPVVRMKGVNVLLYAYDNSSMTRALSTMLLPHFIDWFLRYQATLSVPISLLAYVCIHT